MWRNISEKIIPPTVKLVKISGVFGPEEISLNKPAAIDSVFYIKLSMTAPGNGEHYISNYQLHTEDDKKLGEIVTLEFKCKEDT